MSYDALWWIHVLVVEVEKRGETLDEGLIVGSILCLIFGFGSIGVGLGDARDNVDELNFVDVGVGGVDEAVESAAIQRI